MNQLEDRNLSPMQDTPPGLGGAADYNNREHGIGFGRFALTRGFFENVMFCV